jgi:hypothetical protein
VAYCRAIFSFFRITTHPMSEQFADMWKSTVRSVEALLRKERNMVTITIKGGTPEGYESLCKTCTRGHIISGFRATEEEVFCRTFYIEREIRFPVRECTFYEDRRLASKEDMEEIAWHLRSTTGKPTRNVGFVNGVAFRELESADLHILPAVSDEPKLKE